MNKRAPIMIVAALALPACFLAARSMQATAAPPVPSLAAPTQVADVARTIPADADYMVPGVLDDRSWKPDYDRAVAVQARARPIAHRLRPADGARPSAPEQAPDSAATPIAPAEIAAVPAPLPAEAADPAPSDGIL